MSSLFSPHRFACGLETKNRLLLAPMTNGQSPTGALSESELNWLQRRVEGGFGTVVTCAASVHPSGRAWSGQLRIENEDQQRALEPLANLCQKSEVLGVVQLHHGGVASPSSLTGQQPISASTNKVNAIHKETPRPATHFELIELIESFASAAARVTKAGLDGVEIHGANGYLITQFLSTHFNTRSDDWGGSRDKRARFLFEIAKALSSKRWAQKIVGVRLSPMSTLSHPGIDLADMLWTAQMLCTLGVDYIHLSLIDALALEPSLGVTITEHFKKNLPAQTTLVGAGSITTPEAARAYQKWGADLVALGRTAIANPDWPVRAQMNSAFIPASLPMTPQQLYERGLSEPFVSYLRGSRHSQFVSSES